MSCEYCKDGKPIAEEDDNFVTIGRFDDLMIVFTTEQIHLWNISINYCPMCGSKLGDSDD